VADRRFFENGTIGISDPYGEMKLSSWRWWEKFGGKKFPAVMSKRLPAVNEWACPAFITR
jgi:hypothetical protein